MARDVIIATRKFLENAGYATNTAVNTAVALAQTQSQTDLFTALNPTAMGLAPKPIGGNPLGL